MMNKVVLKKRSRDPKSYTFTLRLSDLIWIGVGSALALSVFFLFGLLIGRGYVATSPEEVSTSATMHAVKAEVDVNATEPGQVEAAPSEAVVLQPEDLNYPEKLGRAEPQVPADPAETPKAAAQATTKPAATAKASTEVDDQGPEEGAAFDMPQGTPGEQAFDYVYQVAAFKDAAQAEALRAKLENKGLTAEVAKASVKGQVWHRVRILFTGTPSQTDPMREAVESVTGQKPLRVSKQPAK